MSHPPATFHNLYWNIENTLINLVVIFGGGSDEHSPLAYPTSAHSVGTVAKAYGINNAGQGVGRSTTTGNGQEHAFITGPDGVGITRS